MNRLKEAMQLVGNDARWTLSDYHRLVSLRNQASGDEARQIGQLVEDFLMQVSPQVLCQIMKMV